MPRYTFLNLTVDVLKKADGPLTSMEIWEKSSEFNQHKEISDGVYEIWDADENNLLLTTKGETPWLTIGATIYSNMKKNPETTQFSKIGKPPNTKFYLKNKATSTKHDKKSSKTKNSTEETKWKEKDLHPLLTYFAHKKLEKARTKTINHSHSTGPSPKKWAHPDLVGFHFSLELHQDLMGLAKYSINDLIKLYSFELKMSLHKGNYTDAFAQAIFNSSWANKSYLVTAKIQDNPMFTDELKRLTSIYGIGIIHLNLENFNSSRIPYPATFKPNVDWETMNKLHTINEDFRKFIAAVKNSLDTTAIYTTEFDPIIDDPQKYIKEHIKKYKKEIARKRV